MKPRHLVAAVLVLMSVASLAQTRSAASTPEERKKALVLTKKLEDKPLGTDATTDRNWLTQWIIEIPDISVPVCDELMKPILQGEMSQYRYSKELFAQAVAGSMAYLIEHPAQSKNSDDQDEFAINKAGMESALKAYEAIVKSGAKAAKWAPLEEMLKKRQNGQLDDYVRTATLRCMTGDTVTAGLRPSCGVVKPASLAIPVR